jgi:adenylosuccinate lyase
MRANLGATRGLIMSERLVFALAGRMGREGAHALVREASARTGERGTTLRDELAADERMPLGASELDAAFVPETYVGAADVFNDRALDLYRRS